MSAIAIDELSLRVQARCVRALRALASRTMFARLAGWVPDTCSRHRYGRRPLTLRSPSGPEYKPATSISNRLAARDLDQFALDHARLYFSGDDHEKYQRHVQHRLQQRHQQHGHIWTRSENSTYRPSSTSGSAAFFRRAIAHNLYGPFYANEWAVYTDGIQDGYPFCLSRSRQWRHVLGRLQSGYRQDKSLGWARSTAAPQTGNTERHLGRPRPD